MNYSKSKVGAEEVPLNKSLRNWGFHLVVQKMKVFWKSYIFKQEEEKEEKKATL